MKGTKEAFDTKRNRMTCPLEGGIIEKGEERLIPVKKGREAPGK